MDENSQAILLSTQVLCYVDATEAFKRVVVVLGKTIVLVNVVWKFKEC